jgi:hypothetical protein
MSVITTSSTPTRTSSTRTRRLPIGVQVLGIAFVGAVVTGGFEALTRAVGVPYAFALPGAEPATMPVSGLFFAVLEFGVVGAILAACLTRWARQPRSTWRRTTVTLTAISLVPSLVAASTTYATNVALAVSHLVAASVIIPLVARRLAETNPRRA